MTALLLAAVGLPGLAAIVSSVNRRGTLPTTLVTRATGVALACAAALAVLVAAGTTGPVTQLALGSGPAPLGLHADRLTVVLLVLVLGVSWIVQQFARRSLAGDAKARRFSILAGLLTTSAAATPAATTLLGLAVAWTATSIALCALIALYRGYEQAEEGVRRTGLALLIGDAALWIAVAILAAEFGTVPLAELPQLAGELDVSVVLITGVLILTAAAARSVQVPFHGWLPATLASPTPVSALLHAGVVNAGAILLLLLSPLLTQAPVLMAAAVVLGTVTAITGTALMLARPDIKGSLAHSTVAQMGFMFLTCGFGLWPAAVLHLSAHGAYKATRFLGSGNAVTQIKRTRAAGDLPHGATPVPVVLALVIAGLPLALVGAALSLPASGLLLLLFAWAALGLAGTGWLATVPGARGILGLSALSIVVGPLYVVFVEAFTHYLEPALPAAAGTLPSPWLLLLIAALLALLPLLWARGPQAARDRLYIWALTVGDGSRPPRSRRGNPAPTLVIAPEGSQL